MNFFEFCADHGLIVDSIQYGKWVKVRTEDKPSKKNGSYFHGGDYAHVQNWALMDETATWFPDKDSINKPFVEKIKKQAFDDLISKQKKAADKAKWIISQCITEKHAYLDSKGLADEVGLVWRPEQNNNLLIIPMRSNGDIVGCQMIDRDGNKKFLYGQKSKGAEFTVGNSGVNIWCEGYATALSIKACLQALRARYTLHVCFSAGNLRALANNGFIVADNDASGTGEKYARETGLKYYLPPDVGDDFNDYHRKAGTFNASMELKKLIL